MLTLGLLFILYLTVFDVKAKAKSLSEWALPRDLQIIHGSVMQMKNDGSLWMGTDSQGGLVTIGKERGSLATVKFSNVDNFYNPTTHSARRVYPFGPKWDHRHATALIGALTGKVFPRGVFCRIKQWMIYVLTGKPIGGIAPSCPLKRDLTTSDPETTVEGIMDKNFYLRNSVLHGTKRVYVRQFEKLKVPVG